MNWLSKKIDEVKKEGVSVSRIWKDDEVNRIARAVARFFGRGTLFMCTNCRGEWNEYGNIRNSPIGYVKQDKENQFLSSGISCPYCERGTVRPKGKA